MIDVVSLSKDPAFRNEVLRAFAKGIGFLGIFLAMLFLWVFLRAEDTLHSWQERFPSKTIAVEMQQELSMELRNGDMETPAQNPAVTVETTPEESPFQQFKKPVTLLENMGHLAIVLADIGVAENFAKSVIEGSHPAITLGFSPYTEHLASLKIRADEKSFESWLMLPLQPIDYPTQDPGPMTILTNAPLELTQDQMDRFTGIGKTGYPGFITNKDHAFTGEDLRSNPMMRAISEKRFAFIEGRNEGTPFARDYAAEHYIPYAQANEWLVRNMGRSEIENALQRVEKMTQMNGSAILMVESTPVSLEILNKWIETLPERKIQLVPLSALAK